MDTIEVLLGKVPLFRTLEAPEIAFLADRCQLIQLDAGTIFIDEGDLGECMYVVVEGSVDIIKAIGTQEESLLAVYREGELIGEMAILNPKQPRSASARTREPVSMLVITRQGVEELLPRFPDVAIDFLAIMSERLYSTANITVRDLTAKNKELNEAYSELQAAQDQLIRQEVLEQELRHAQSIQQQMLPERLPDTGRIDIDARMIAARMVGGDFYDVIQLDEDRLALVVGDVSGKGIPAALFMALVSTLLRVAIRTTSQPEDVLAIINEQLVARDMDSMFVTVLFGVLALPTRDFSYAMAGHSTPCLWHQQDGLVQLPPARSRPLGLVSETLLQCGTVRLQAGSTILLYTDGVTETMDARGQLFGRERLVGTLPGSDSLDAQALCNHIIEVVERYRGDAPQHDDITLLACRLA